MSVLARRARVAQAEGDRCPHCAQPVREARFRRTNSLVRLDPTPAANGNLMLIEPGGFVEFIGTARRDPKHPEFVAESDRFVSHRVSCVEHERTLSAVDEEFIADVDRRLTVGRSMFASLDQSRDS